jgi:NADP-dependent 3-hydroxy acid dehydrogenase YdfG
MTILLLLVIWSQEMKTPLLYNKTAIVTGASSGIGRAIALNLARDGAHVFLTGRDAQRLEGAARTIGREGGLASIEAFDLHDSDRLQNFIATTAKKKGRLDIMVNAAGVDHPGTIADGGLREWRDMFDINVIAMLVGSQAAIRGMRETKSQGHIVTVSSYAGRGDGYRVYGATKAAINSLCMTLRNELEDEPIRVVNVMPGAVATNFGRNHGPEFVNGLLESVGLSADFKTGDVLPDSTLEALNARATAVFAAPDDIARAVLYAVTQPSDVNVSEILVGPRKAFPQHV